MMRVYDLYHACNKNWGCRGYGSDHTAVDKDAWHSGSGFEGLEPGDLVSQGLEDQICGDLLSMQTIVQHQQLGLVGPIVQGPCQSSPDSGPVVFGQREPLIETALVRLLVSTRLTIDGVWVRVCGWMVTSASEPRGPRALKLAPVVSAMFPLWVKRSSPAEANRGAPEGSGHSFKQRFAGKHGAASLVPSLMTSKRSFGAEAWSGLSPTSSSTTRPGRR